MCYVIKKTTFPGPWSNYVLTHIFPWSNHVLQAGGFTLWTDFTACSATCGGMRMRTRTCTNPAPKNGGNDCVGHPAEAETCSDPCPGQTTALVVKKYYNGQSCLIYLLTLILLAAQTDIRQHIFWAARSVHSRPHITSIR